MKRLESLQIIRAIAMIYIVSFHCGLNHLGGAGVSIFIIQSGFLLGYRNYNVELPGDVISSLVYGIKKIKKLYGLHIVTAVLSLPFLIYEVMLSHELLYKNISEVILNVLLIKSWIPNNDIVTSLNTVSWYLCTIIFLYCCFPKIIHFLQKQNKALNIVLVSVFLAVMSMVVSYCSSVLPIYDENELDTIWFFSYIFPPARLIDFAIGCNIGFLFAMSGKRMGKKVGTVMEIIAIVLLLLMEYITRIILASDIYWMNYTTIYIPFSLFCIWVFANGAGYISKIMCNKVVLYLADRSAYIFLIHFVVSRYLRNNVIYKFDAPINPIFMFIIVSVISLIFAELWAARNGKATWQNGSNSKC